jgi:hypothetical protein
MRYTPNHLFRKVLLSLAGCIASTGAPALLLASLPLSAQAASVVDDDLLMKVAHIESNGNPMAVGDSGLALGAFQMHRDSWEDSVRRLFGTIPRSYAYCKANCFDWKKSCVVAQEHLRWLEERQVKMGISPTKISLYMSYNLGNTGAYRYAYRHDNPRLPQSRRRILQRAFLLLQTK